MSASESNPDELRLIVAGKRAVADAVDAARAFARARRLDKGGLARLCIVVEELIANLYDHGGVTDADQLSLSFRFDANGIRVSIIAPGMPFDPWSTPRNETGRNGGGAGVSLIRAWSELVSYHPAGGANRLEILVPLAKQV